MLGYNRKLSDLKEYPLESSHLVLSPAPKLKRLNLATQILHLPGMAVHLGGGEEQEFEVILDSVVNLSPVSKHHERPCSPQNPTRRRQR